MKNLGVCALLFSCFVIRINSLPIADESKKINPEIMCRQAFIIGDCTGASAFWSYDASKGKCRESCGNNENKFATKKKCQETCNGVFDRNDEPNDSEEIRIKAYERVNDPDVKEPDLLNENI